MSDINFNTNNLDKLPQYKAAFDGLRDAVNNLNSSVNDLEKGIASYNKQNQETVNWGVKIKNTVKDLADTFNTAKSAISLAEASLGGWQGIAAAAFTLITTYGPKVLDYLDKIFQSDKTRAAAQALKDYKDIMENYTSNVSSQLAQLQTQANIANNTKLPEQIRIEAIKKLNQLSPEYLSNLTKENIQTKEGKKMLDEYTKSLNRKAMEESVQAKKTDYIKQMLAMKDELQAAKKEVDAYNNGSKKNEITHSENFNGEAGMGHFSSDTEDVARNTYSKLKAQHDYLANQVKTQDSQLAKDLLPFAPSNKINLNHDKDYWENELQKQQTALGKMDAGAKDFETKSLAIRARIQSAKKILSAYDINDAPVKKPAATKSANNKQTDQVNKQAENERIDSLARLVEINLDGYAKEIAATDNHFEQLKEKFKNNKATVEQLEKERVATLAAISKKYQEGDLKKLDDYEQQLLKIRADAGKTVEQLAMQQVKDEYAAKLSEIDEKENEAKKQQDAILQQQVTLRHQGKIDEANDLNNVLEIEKNIITKAGDVKILLVQDQAKAEQKIRDDAAKLANEKKEKDAEDKLESDIKSAQDGGHATKALMQQKQLLDMQYTAAISAAKKQGTDTAKVEDDFAKKKAQIEDQLVTSKIHAGDKFIDAALKNSKKDSAIYKAAFLAKKATAIADTVISTRRAVIDSLKAYSGIPFIGQALGIVQSAFMAGQGALSIAEIAKQKPGFAKGGYFSSDGRGALLSGYSRMDNTNAYLRSGEAVVVSEAMRNPWARNLVSAINVAYGGRDFSMSNPGRGYAIGGIFTDGGNSNRYYNQPVNDQKDLANTIAYQMINNFPPVYVDVKDINSQQNILAQTINRVNL